MFYPNNKQRIYKSKVNYKNRGLTLEHLIMQANEYYRDNDLAYIYKKPTPIRVVKKEYNKITEAFYESPSTLDFNGIYKGKYIEFDAKECQSKTSFPLSNIHDHQMKHIRNVYNHGGIVFLIIWMNEKYYILKGKDLIDFYDQNTRKSIPYEYIKKMGIEINMTLRGLDYLSKLDKEI